LSHIDHCAIMQQSEIKEIVKLLVFTLEESFRAHVRIWFSQTVTLPFHIKFELRQLTIEAIISPKVTKVSRIHMTF
jgi:hypothetical protein